MRFVVELTNIIDARARRRARVVLDHFVGADSQPCIDDDIVEHESN